MKHLFYIFFSLVFVFGCVSTDPDTGLSKGRMYMFGLDITEIEAKQSYGEWGYDTGRPTYFWDRSDSLKGWLFDPNAKRVPIQGSFWMKLPDECNCDTLSDTLIN